VTLSKMLEPVAQDLTIFENRFVVPILSLEASSVEKFLHDNTDSANILYSTILTKIFLNGGVQVSHFVKAIPDMIEAIDEALKENHGVIPESTRSAFREALVLELNNEIDALHKYREILLSGGLNSLASAHEIDLDRGRTISGKLYLCLLAFLKGFKRQNQNLLMAKLSSLALEYAEVKGLWRKGLPSRRVG